MKQKWNRPLALLLSAAMLFSMSGTPVYAVDVETGASAVCPHHVHDETCGYSEGSPCTFDPADCELCNSQENPAEQTVTAWEWIGADSLNEGVLLLSGASAENPVDFDTVVSLLPTGITATVDGSEEPVELALTWSCEGFPEQAAEGEYTFTAELPEGYTLAADAASLAVSVILGGGTTLDGNGQPDGEGTKESPYQISTADELFWFASLVNGTLEGMEQNTAACAVLTADINLSGQTWTPIGISTSNYFKGTFDGADHTISNLTIDTNASYVGLFGATSGATLKNVTLDRPQVKNSAGGTSNTGALVGFMAGSGTTEYCAVTNGSVSSDGQYVGGLIGNILGGTAQYCYNYETTVISTNDTQTYVNGVAGRTGNYTYLGSSFSYVSNQKELKASNTANYAAYLSDTPTERAYGINGDQHGFTADQFQDGTVAYFLRTGFYANVSYEGWGQTLGADNLADNLPKWNGEAVESLKYAHLGADNKAEDAYAYFNALTQGTDGTYYIEDTSDWIAFVKLVKEDNGYDADAVVEKDVVIDFSQFGTLTNKSTYSYLVIADKNSGFSYTGTFNGNGCTVTGVSYSGTMEFALFGTIGKDGSVSGITLEEPKISGTTAGAYNIAGIASHNYGTIDDCHVDGGTISTVATTAAGIAAESFGTVKNCTNSADITAKYEVAGIVATSNSTNGNTSETAPMVIEGCSNSGTITATNAGASYAGGIFGGKNMFSSSKYPYGTISKCFNTGNILGQSYIGGIVGYSIKNANASAANVTIENCYNTGAIGDDNTTGVAGGISAGTNSSVTNCFNMGDVTGTNAQPIVANGQGVQAWSVNSYASCEVNGPTSGYLYYGADNGVHPGPTDEQGRYCRGSGKRTIEEMASGEVAYLLQQEQENGEQVWSQQIGVDDHPVLVINGEPAPVVLITVKLVDDGGTATELTKCYTNKGNTLSAYPKPDDSGAVYTFYTEVACTNKIDTATKTYNADATIFAKVTELTVVDVSGVSVTNKEYNGTQIVSSGTPTAEKDDATISDLQYVYTWYSVSGSSETQLTSAPADAGSYKLVVSVDSDTYTGQQEIPFEINQKEITAAVTGSVTKEYDGDTTVPSENNLFIKLDGLVDADKGSVTASAGSYAYGSAEIGSGITITANNVTLSGDRAFNYQLTGEIKGDVGEITKVKINTLTPPGNQTLDEYCSDAQAVIAKLPTTATGTATSGNNVQVTLEWRIEGGNSYNSAPGATNSFTWTAAAPENYAFASGVDTTGTITVTNKAATKPSIMATNQEVTYDGSTIDVSTMFSGIPAGSNPTYSIVTGSGTTGTGTLSGTTLTVTTAGTFSIKVTTEAVGNYAAGEATAILTVNKGSFTATVTMGNYAEGGTPSTPSVSSNPCNGNVTYYYSTTGTTGGGTEWTTDKGKDLAVGTYYMYAVIDATDLYNSCTTSATSFQVIDASAGIVPPTAKTLTYTGKPQELVTAGSIEGGTMVYSLSEKGEYSREIPTETDAGYYTVWYKAADAAEAIDKVSVQIQQAVIVSFDIPEDYYLEALYTKGEDVAALLRNEFDPATGRTADGTEIKIKITGWDYDIYINTRPSAVNEFEWWISQSNPNMDNYTLADSLLDGQSFASGTIDVHNLPNVTINFDANGGSVQPTSATTVNYKLASLPTPTRSGYVFDGWFTQETDGEKVTTDTVFIAETTIYAQWSDVPTPVSPSYRVTVEDTVNGEAESSRSWASKDTTITLTVVPDDGYELASLTITKSNGDEVQFTDKGNGKFTFTMPGSNVTVEAIFKAITPGYDDCPQDETCPIWPFTDASTTVWYHDGVHFCIDEGLMEGYGGDLFGPNDTLSRAQLCQIVYNMEGQPDVTGDSVFTDVADGAWYADAVTWAAENGIVGGYGNGKFGPDAPITREQLAAILYRYAQAKGYDTTQGGMAIREYADFEQISDYAVEAMTWAVNTGLISGTSTTTLSPQGLATRAQVATILMRFIEGMA